MKKISIPYYECGKCGHEFKNYNPKGEAAWPSKCPQCGNDASEYKMSKVICVYPASGHRDKIRPFIP